MVRKSVCVACAFFLSVVMLGVELYVAVRAQPMVHPIGKLAGRWAGDGTLVPTYGRNEQFRCIITYAVGEAASRIRQHLRCQGDETQFDAVTRLDIENGRVTGVWADNVYSLNGTVRGSVTDKGFDIRLLGTFFQAQDDGRHVRLRAIGQARPRRRRAA